MANLWAQARALYKFARVLAMWFLQVCFRWGVLRPRRDNGCAFTCSPPAPALRGREKASSKHWHTASSARTPKRTTGNLEVKLKTTTGENRGGCAPRSQGETCNHPYSSSSRGSSCRRQIRGFSVSVARCSTHPEPLHQQRGGEEDQRGGCPERRRTMEGMQAYGAGKAGGAFDPVTFFQQPQTILRIVSWVSDSKRQKNEK